MAYICTMYLDKTTRELMLSRIEKIDKKIACNKQNIYERKDGNFASFCQMWNIEIDLLKIERERIKQALIKNEYTFEY